MEIKLLVLTLGCLLTAIEGSPLLLFANRKDLRLVDARNSRGNESVLVNNLEDAAALDFYFEEQSVFWADITLEMIKRTWVNGSQTVEDVITTGLVSPDGLACDWIGGHIYWADSETNRIEISHLDGENRKVLFWQNLDQPRAIALDPLTGFMFWTDWGEVPKIERAGMNGDVNTRHVIIDSNIHWPNGITVDYGANKIYWSDAKLSYIHRCNYDGSSREVIVSENLPHPFALTLFQDTLYWTDWQTSSIHSANKNTGRDRRVVHSGIHSPMDIHVYTSQRQPSKSSPCQENNGGCSHLCLLAPYEPYYTCACPTGVKLLDDFATCAQGAKDILLLVRRTDIRQISLDTPDYTDIELQYDDIKHAIAVDYDPIEGYIYWTDDQVQVITRAFLDGTGQEVVVSSGIYHPDGIAVDWVARNIFWTDTGTDRIEVARLNGTSRKVLIAEDLEEPRAIALDPMAGQMYWSDWGSHPKIEMANMDGSERTILVNTSIGWPNGLAIDFDERKLYWGDGDKDKIEVINLDGTGRRVIVSNDLPHIFGFSLLGDYVYWTDWQHRTIERVNKRTGNERTMILEQLPDLMGLKATTRVYKGSENDFAGNMCAQGNGGCSHLCLNRAEPLGATCACPMGLELSSSNKTCIVPEAFLLLSRRKDIRRISLEENHSNDIIPLAGIESANALDFDINDNRIYWSDLDQKTISRSFMNGSAVEHIVQFGVQYPEGMAVDWVAHNIYWTDMGLMRIEMARLDGRSRKVLIWKDLVDPHSLALNPAQGYIYWSAWSENGWIERASLDGSNRKVIISKVGRPNGLTIDYADSRIYWTDINNNVIESADLEGWSRRAVISDGLPNPYGLTQYEDFIYWTDMTDNTIERANKTDGMNRSRISGDLELIMDILVFHTSRQAGWNSCGGGNGGCSHICFAHSAEFDPSVKYHCDCPTHYTLGEDNSTCYPPSSFLLFSRKNVISRMLLDMDSAPDVVLPIDAARNIRSMAYDPVDEFVYWIEGRVRTIKRAPANGTNGSDRRTFVPNPTPHEALQPFDLAIDPYSRHVYWTDAVNNVINVTHMDMRSVGVVVSGDQQKPRSLVLAPDDGLMFWTNMVKPPRIQRAKMDGTSMMSLFPIGLGTPGELAVDPVRRKLYWTDTELRRIEVSDFDGSNRKVLVGTNIFQPVSLTVYGDYVYWADRTRDQIDRIKRDGSGGRLPTHDRITQLSDIIGVTQMTKATFGNHPCSDNNGGCSHICYSKSDGTRVCSCPEDLMLGEDEISCSTPPTCGPEEFTCLSGTIHCIPSMWRCDGYNECEDSSDEHGCPECSEKQFQCKNGDCIDLSERCNGKPKCIDHSDEENCAPCSDSEFMCSRDRTCIDRILECDGKSDCVDGEDEYHCPTDYRHHIQRRGDSSTAQFTVGIVVGLVAIVFVSIFAAFACRRKNQQTAFDPNCDIIMVTKPLTAPNNVIPVHMLPSRGKSGSSCLSASSQNGVRPPLYERANGTGASSTASSVTHYPKETLNPPPSPVTSYRSRCTTDFNYSSTNSPSTVRSYRHPYRHAHIPPPPCTPCSTDVCNDSEPYFCGKRYYNSLAELDSESEPIYPPPPPTPRSHYFSDDMSCPPSPSTERSFYNPYPPPPSPVGMSDC